MNIHLQLFVALAISTSAGTAFSQNVMDQFSKDASSQRVEDVHRSLTTRAVPFGALCDPNMVLGKEYDEIKSMLKNGKGLEADLSGEVLTKNAASCGVAFKERADAPFADWALYAGVGLLAKLMNNPPHREDETAKKARIYLSYAESKGYAAASKGIEILNKSIQSFASSHDNAISISTSEMVKNLKDNYLKFWTTYGGKLLNVTGTVFSIDGGNSAALIHISGSSKSKREIEGLFDVVLCYITDANDIAKAANLTKGQQINTRGILKKGEIGTVMILDQCSFSNVSGK